MGSATCPPGTVNAAYPFVTATFFVMNCRANGAVPAAMVFVLTVKVLGTALSFVKSMLSAWVKDPRPSMVYVQPLNFGFAEV